MSPCSAKGKVLLAETFLADIKTFAVELPLVGHVSSRTLKLVAGTPRSSGNSWCLTEPHFDLESLES